MFWAKTYRDASGQEIPGISVRDHCLNVGCVAEALIKRLPRPLQDLVPPGAVTLAALHGIEHASKALLYGCEDCGDCSLPDTGYFCPRAACSKTGRSGPCGGSSDGRCELKDKDCIWARAYDRLKSYGESQHMIEGPAVFANAALSGTSSWANSFLGRDHHHAGVPDGQTAPSNCAAPPEKKS